MIIVLILFTLKSLNKAQSQEEDNEILQFYEDQASCPYCDPNYMDIPNLQEAMKGYEVPVGDPTPDVGMSDPGIRNMIFQPMIKSDMGFYEIDGSFMTATPFVQCVSEWNEEVYYNFKSYAKGKEDSSFISIENGPKYFESLKIKSLKPFKAKLPPLFSYSLESDRTVDLVRSFFALDKGAIAVSSAVCYTHRIDILEKSPKKFTQPFLDGIRGLHSVLNGSESEKQYEFKRFVHEFGTHYPETTILGVKLLIERRYPQRVKEANFKSTLKKCGTYIGAKLYGFKFGKEKTTECLSLIAQEDTSSSIQLERIIVSAYGGFVFSNLSDWSKNIIDMNSKGTLSPRAIKRKLVSILKLFNDDGLKNLKFDDRTTINTTEIALWLAAMMPKYCQIFKVECNITGCGIDDYCELDEICIEEKRGVVSEDIKVKSAHSLPNGNTLKCGYKRSIDLALTDGNKYIGEINSSHLPSGMGRLLDSKEHLLYKGNFHSGFRNGSGMVFSSSGGNSKVKIYKGSFFKGLAHGNGIIYSIKKPGKVIYKGSFNMGNSTKKLIELSSTKRDWYFSLINQQVIYSSKKYAYK